MFQHTESDGTVTIILDNDDTPLRVELAGGNGNFFTVSPDGSLTDQDGVNMLRAYYF